MSVNENTEQSSHSEPSSDSNQAPKASESTEPQANTPIEAGEPKDEIPAKDRPFAGLPNETDQAAREVQEAVRAIKAEIGKVIIGQKATIDMLIAALLTNGHVLLEGVPGIAKTLTSKLMSKCLDTDFSRIQFTPDLMPTDIIGTSIFDMKRSEFYFKRGPIFSSVILIDEINRAPAKTQAALMEVMEEEQVTVDGTTYPMAHPFFVVATQNPVEQEGTYKLPEAQLDRFMFKLEIGYPSQAEEEEMLKRFSTDFYGKSEATVKSVISTGDIMKYRVYVEEVFIKDELLRYIAELISLTRNNSDLYLGASPRASINIVKGAKALALMAGRSFVTPDDIKRVAYPILNHRLILSYDREIEGIAMSEVVEGLLRKLEVPR